MSTLANYIRALELFSPFFEKGMETTYFMQAEHDQIYMFVDIEKIPEDSEIGKQLVELGWFVDENDGWSYYT